ncbi:MAG: NifU family protein [Acidimicrobiia bacterium]|nr:NifU family protein [bacterium]MXZ07159.1 NifU family protein [Acidimicrobiia bacterium]
MRISPTETAVTVKSTARDGESVEVDQSLLASTLEYIRPALQYDGGDLILEGVDEDGTVNLNLVGACSGCPMSMMTLTAGIERILIDRVPGVTAVKAL